MEQGKTIIPWFKAYIYKQLLYLLRLRDLSFLFQMMSHNIFVLKDVQGF